MKLAIINNPHVSHKQNSNSSLQTKFIRKFINYQ
jgi:hypothetical protein